MDYESETRNRDNNSDMIEERMSLETMIRIYQAYADVIVPQTPKLAEQYGKYMLYGAIDFQIGEYLVMLLQTFGDSFPEMLAEILEIVAKQVLFLQEKEKLLMDPSFLQGGVMEKLNKEERINAVSLLDYNKVHSHEFALLFESNPEFLSMINELPKLTMFGYYSEWYGYGTTRFDPLGSRKFEFSPISWEQVGYPGPARGYISEVKEYYEIKKNRMNHE